LAWWSCCYCFLCFGSTMLLEGKFAVRIIACPMMGLNRLYWRDTLDGCIHSFSEGSSSFYIEHFQQILSFEGSGLVGVLLCICSLFGIQLSDAGLVRNALVLNAQVIPLCLSINEVRKFHLRWSLVSLQICLRSIHDVHFQVGEVMTVQSI